MIKVICSSYSFSSSAVAHETNILKINFVLKNGLADLLVSIQVYTAVVGHLTNTYFEGMFGTMISICPLTQ